MVGDREPLRAATSLSPPAHRSLGRIRREPGSGPSTLGPARRRLAVTAMRILVVDDYPDAAESLAELLSLRGHVTRTAGDAETALRLARTFQPELVLCDPMQPAGEGVALFARYQQDPRLGRARFIAVTTLDGQPQREQLRTAGFDGHLLKPVELDQLEGALAGAE
jgi:CheY-like chemotaxis protein